MNNLNILKNQQISSFFNNFTFIPRNKISKTPKNGVFLLANEQNRRAMDKNENSCEIEAIVSFDERGQLVIPKDLRKKFNLKAGDKFALISCMTRDSGSSCGPSDGKSNCCDTTADGGGLCCFTLVNTKQLKGLVAKTLGPMLGQLLK